MSLIDSYRDDVWRALIAERYSLIRTVGTGGMGRVWLARDEMLRREVAVKEVVPPDWMSAAERDLLRQVTMREARAAARLNHPNVVQIYDVVHAEGRPWIVMEYVRSRSLQEAIDQDGPLPPQQVARIGLAVLYALRAAHQAGVLHRDVKPHNVLIAADGRVVLTDFGLATFDGGDGALTRGGMVMGSPQYVAPERARDGASTIESDLWSLGATLFAAVEGHSPYARSTTMATLTALATAPPDPAHRAGALRPVLGGLLRKDPRHRLNAEEAERLLRRAAEPEQGRNRLTLPRQRRSTENARPEFPAARQRRGRYLTAGAAVALVAAVGTTGAALALDHDGVEPRLIAIGPTTPSAAAAFACAAPPPTPPARPAAPVDPRYALPDGFVWHADPSGFQMAVPATWMYFRDGDVACFREPNGPRLLAVDTAPGLTGDPVAHWRSEEKRVKLSGYALVGILPNRYYEGGADWDCTWTSAKGERLRARRELFRTSATRAYTILWVTRDLDWPGSLTHLNLINASFKPSP